jgi:hypothetical protein
MPTLFRWKGHRFFFYSADCWEPPHVHVYKDGKEAKIWLNDLRVAVNLRFSGRDLSEIVAVVEENRTAFLRAWNDHFGS